ncbi:MAG: hypothetical protein S0880_18215 [Actinomycetota bacterium]|nr:hypothetical protein [Actinomycetota bacterium]
MPATHRALASIFAVLSVAIFAFGGGARAASAQPGQQTVPSNGGLTVNPGAGTLADGLTADGSLVVVVENVSSVPGIARLSSQFSGIGPTVCLQPGDQVTFSISDPDWIAFWIDNGVQVYAETAPDIGEWPDCGTGPADGDPEHDFGTISWPVSCDPNIARTTPCLTETTIEPGTPAPFPWIVSAQVTPGGGGGTTTTSTPTSSSSSTSTSTSTPTSSSSTSSTTPGSSTTSSTTPSSTSTTQASTSTTASAGGGPVVLPTITTTSTSVAGITTTAPVQVSPATAFLPATGRDPLVLVASAMMLLASGLTLLVGQRRALATIAVRTDEHHR